MTGGDAAVAVTEHPGSYIADELAARGWDIAGLARRAGLDYTETEQIVNQQRPVTADTAQKLGAVFGTSSEIWVHLQNRHDQNTGQQRRADTGDAHKPALEHPVTNSNHDGYQMILTVGVQAEAVAETLAETSNGFGENTPTADTFAETVAKAKTVDMTPAEATPQAVLDRLVETGLHPGDLRTRTLVVVGDDPTTAVLAYTALAGFAGRRLAFTQHGGSNGSEPVDAAQIDRQARQTVDSGKPEHGIAQILTGATHETLRTAALTNETEPGVFAGDSDDAALIRHARRVRFVPSESSSDTISQLLVIAGLRARDDIDRFPTLCDGSEPFDPARPSEEAGTCLDALRRQALALRREQKTGVRDSVAPFEPPTSRNLRLDEAARTLITETMSRLGAVQNDTSGLWHCPRPERHSNGDQNPSMKAADDKTRCFRCDMEKIDSLRLVMDCLGCTADEAADWLLDPNKPARTVEREPVAA